MGISASLYAHTQVRPEVDLQTSQNLPVWTEKQHRSNGPCIAAEIRNSADLFLKGSMYIIIYCDKENEVQRVEVA